MEKYLKRGYF